jgi:uncharacterized protein YeaO (DUF488 family)
MMLPMHFEIQECYRHFEVLISSIPESFHARQWDTQKVEYTLSKNGFRLRFMTSITTYRYGSPRSATEGLRIGVARHVPRGVRREEWQKRNYFDIWVPLLAPSSELVADYRHEEISFTVFKRRYQREMKHRESLQAIELVAAMAFFEPISLGCYCEDGSLCHRSILQALIIREAKVKAAAFSSLSARQLDAGEYASPACSAKFDQD